MGGFLRAMRAGKNWSYEVENSLASYALISRPIKSNLSSIRQCQRANFRNRAKLVPTIAARAEFATEPALTQCIDLPGT